MRTLVLSMVLLTATVPAYAGRARWVGTVASDLGGVLRLQGRLRQLAPGHWVGLLNCRPLRPGVSRCLSKHLTATMVVSSGSFQAAIAGQGVNCTAEGSATASNVAGRYECAIGASLVDAGVFALRRR